MVNNTFSYELIRKSRVNFLIDSLSKSYDCDLEELRSYNFYTNPKGKIFISKFRVDELELERVNAVGLYFGTLHDNDRFRLSIEGSKFIKPKKNFIKLNSESLKFYISAENLRKDQFEEVNVDGTSPFIIVQFEEENMGCVSFKGNEALTYVPKSRKLDLERLF